MMEFSILSAGGAALEIELQFGATVSREFHGALAGNMALLDRFFSDGGILRTQRGAAIISRVTATPGSIIIAYPTWDLGGEGLGVVLRVLKQACAGVPLTRVVVAAPEDALSELRDAMDEVPSRDDEPPFALEIQPTDKWVNLECEFERPPSAAEHEELQRLILSWTEVGSLGGFDQSALLAEVGAEPGEAGIAVAGRSVGDDFAQWQFALAGNQFGAVNTLVNLLAEYSRQTCPLSLVYIG